MDDPRSVIQSAKDEEQKAERLVYLTVKEFAELRRVHVQTVYSAIRFKRMKYRVERPSGTNAIRIAVPQSYIRPPLIPRPAPVFQGVYFLRCGEFVKVGLARDVRRSLIGLRHVIPNDIVPIGFIPAATIVDAQRLERDWLQVLREWHHRGEWFVASEGLLEMISEAVSPWPESSAA